MSHKSRGNCFCFLRKLLKLKRNYNWVYLSSLLVSIHFEKYFFNATSMDSISYPIPIHIKTNRIKKFIDIVKDRKYIDFTSFEKNLEKINKYFGEIFNLKIVVQNANYITNREKKVDLFVYDKDENIYDPLDLGSGFNNILSILYNIFSVKKMIPWKKKE